MKEDPAPLRRRAPASGGDGRGQGFFGMPCDDAHRADGEDPLHPRRRGADGDQRLAEPRGSSSLIPSAVTMSALAARAAAPVGAHDGDRAGDGVIWGQHWGTWWAWGSSPPSSALRHIGYVALWEVVDEPDKGGGPDRGARLGSVFALLSRYAVFFCSEGLHQGRSLLLDWQENVHDAFWWPLCSIAVRAASSAWCSCAPAPTDTLKAAPRASGDRGAGVMPDLDAYAGNVLGAYGVTLALIAGWVSVWRGRRGAARTCPDTRRRWGGDSTNALG